jgi:hypothetical protein
VSTHQNKYLDMLKAEKGLGEQLPKLPKLGFVGFGTSALGAFSRFLAALDAEGVPCGGVPELRARRVLALAQVP